MLKSYFTVAMRTILKNKLYSFINVAGMAIGLASCLLIFLFVRDETGYDRWLPNAENIYRVEGSFLAPGRAPFLGATTMPAIRNPLQADFPEIEQATRLFSGRTAFRWQDKPFNEWTAFVDANFFEVFDLTFVEGGADTSFADKNSMILTERMARKFFGDDPALGQTLTAQNDVDYRVTGVIVDLPQNTHLKFDMIARLDSVPNADQFLEAWLSYFIFNYVKLAPDADPDALTSRLPDFIDRHIPVRTVPGFEDATPSDVVGLWLVPIRDIHLLSQGERDMKPGGNINTVRIFSAIAVLILLIACLNFMNLATAKSTQRAREVCMRKVLGAGRGQLVVQFLAEAILITMISLGLAMALIEVVLPWYNNFLGKEIMANFIADTRLLATLLILTATVGLASGAYPAIYLSSVRPAAVLKANQSSGRGSARLRSILVFSQFAISIALIVATAVVYGQTVYAGNLDLGFQKDNMLVLRGLGAADSRSASNGLKREIEAVPGVLSVGRSNAVPGDPIGFNTPVTLPDADATESTWIAVTQAEPGFFETLGMASLAGRYFSEDIASDSITVPNEAFDFSGIEVNASVILNQSAVKRLGYGNAAAAIGRSFRMQLNGTDSAEMTVVGVVPDIHFLSLHNPIRPMLFYQYDVAFNNMIVRLDAESASSAIAEIERIWNARIPDAQMQREFLDELIDARYDGERQQSELFLVFSALAIIVACLGLFGLAAFATERRTREIGVRKVFGAKILDIIRLLVWQFSKPVVAANVIAWPVAWYFMRGWLDGFAYRIDLSIFYFLGAGLLTLIIAWATVGVHAARVARANPIHALRYE